MLKNPSLVQAIGDAVIPVLGFFFFEWGLYFILLFYFIDLLVTEYFVFLKARKITKHNSRERINKQRLILSVFTALVLIVLCHVSLYFIIPGINFLEEFKAFLLYEEVGIPIPQGFILLPLVALGNLQQYKQFFVRPQKHLMLTVDYLYKKRTSALLLGIAGCGLALAGAIFLQLNTTVLLVLLVVSKFFVDIKWRV